MDYFAGFSVAKDIQHRMAKVLVNEELKEICGEMAMAYFEVICWNLPVETEKS